MKSSAAILASAITTLLSIVLNVQPALATKYGPVSGSTAPDTGDILLALAFFIYLPLLILTAIINMLRPSRLTRDITLVLCIPVFLGGLLTLFLFWFGGLLILGFGGIISTAAIASYEIRKRAERNSNQATRA